MPLDDDVESAHANPFLDEEVKSFWAKMGSNISAKGREWRNRYILAETVGACAVMIGALLTAEDPEAVKIMNNVGTNSPFLEAVTRTYILVLLDNAASYTMLFLKHSQEDREIAHRSAQSYGFIGGLRTIRNMVPEYAAGEIIDSVFVKPLTMGSGMNFLFKDRLGIYSVFEEPLGAAVGKVVSDCIAYLPLNILSYEIRKKLFPREQPTPIPQPGMD